MNLEQNTVLGYSEMLSPNAAHFHQLLSPTAHHSFLKGTIKIQTFLVISLHVHDAIVFNKCFHSIAGCHLCNQSCKI